MMTTRSLAAAAALAFGLVVSPAFAGAGQQGGNDDGSQLVSIDIKGVSAENFSARLTALVGEKVVFVPTDEQGLVSLQVSRYPVNQLLTDLSKLGAVAVGGRPVEGQANPKGAVDLSLKVSLNAKEIGAGEMGRLLSGLLHQTVEFLPKSSAPESFKINLDVKGMSLGELLSQLEQFGTISPPPVS